MNTTTRAAELIAYRVRKGANPTESATLLDELAIAHTGYNLAHALQYNGFVSVARSEQAAHDLEIERVDEHVAAVAELLPFPAALDADMGGLNVLQINLGCRSDDQNDPHDRAGIDPHEPRATWWIETAGGTDFEDSHLPATTPPAHVAQWITTRATHLGCPTPQAQQLLTA